MIELLFNVPAVAVLVVVVVGLLYHRRRSQPTLPDLPWLNSKDGELFTRLRATVRTTFNYRQALLHAYETYSKTERSCILSSIAGVEILLPASAATWIINQPDSNLSAHEAQVESLEGTLTFATASVVQHPSHTEVIKSELTRNLGSLTEDIMDELAHAFDEIWGQDTSEWKEICPFESLTRVIAHTSNRVFLGLPWCRNEELLAHGMGFATAVPVSATILKQLPKFLRPLVAVLVARPNRQHTKAFARLLRPEIERRQRLLEAQGTEAEKKLEEPEPNDFLQWTIRRARNSADPFERDPAVIAERIVVVNFAAIHTSTFSITNLLFDLVASDPSKRYLDELREEAASVLDAEDGVWTKAALAKMVKADSALRESSRLGSFLGTGLIRKVVARDGVVAPNGTFCPYGSAISIPTNGVHHDPENYPDPARFDPFRFSSQRTAATETEGEAAAKEEGRNNATSDEYLKKANLSFVSTSPLYNSFGHGRHACPGRFFAANELKLLLAYMLMNYDLEMLETRPESKWLATSLMPPMKATIRIRRRKTDGSL